jgi:hypothetical protein
VLREKWLWLIQPGTDNYNAFLFAPPCLAQADRGSVSGTITDTAGSVIPGASVTATHEATGGQNSTVTTSAGDYVISNITNPAVLARVFGSRVLHVVERSGNGRCRRDGADSGCQLTVQEPEDSSQYRQSAIDPHSASVMSCQPSGLRRQAGSGMHSRDGR